MVISIVHSRQIVFISSHDFTPQQPSVATSAQLCSDCTARITSVMKWTIVRVHLWADKQLDFRSQGFRSHRIHDWIPPDMFADVAVTLIDIMTWKPFSITGLCGGFPAQWDSTEIRGFNIFTDFNLNKFSIEQSTLRWFQAPWRPYWHFCGVLINRPVITAIG